MKTLREDLSSPIYKIDRVWLRRSLTLFLYIIIIPISITLGVIKGATMAIKIWFKLCW